MEGLVIWYLMDCCGQDEAETVVSYRKYLTLEAAKDIFVLTYDRMRRYEGTWHTEKKLLFPSYVFLDSENRRVLLKELGESRRLLCIRQAEEGFLRDLYGDSRHLKMSKGIVKNGFPKVTEGPLKGLEQRICRIDRHKRIAKLMMPAEQNIGYITAGLEITEKI